MKKLIVSFVLLSPALLLATPHAPSNLIFTDVTAHSVTLNWVDNSNNETGFKIYQGDELLVQTAPNIENFTVGGLNPNTEYSFSIKATDDRQQYNSGKALTKDELHELILNYCKNPTDENKIAIEKANTSEITSMYNIFDVSKECDASGAIFDGDISGWDTSKVTDMRNMFKGSNISTLPPSFNTSNVVNMSGMFRDSKITKLPENFDTSKVKYMSRMFWNSKIKKLPENFDTSHLRSAYWMFYGSNIEITSENFIKNIVKVDSIFGGAGSTKIKLPKRLDTTGITNFDGLFKGYKGENMPEIDTSNATSMKYMFAHSDIKNLPENFDTSNVTDMQGMFAFSRVSKLPDSFDTSKVTNMKFMFRQNEVTNLPDSFDTSNVTDMKGMFASSKLTKLPENFDTSNVTNMEGMFSVYNYYTDQMTAADYNDVCQIPGEGGVTDDDLPPKSTYADTCQIEYLPEGFDTSKVTNMKWMFYKNRKITSLPNSFDTSNVINMVSMFQDSIIKELPMFDTSKVDTMINMFRDTKEFNQDISGWDVSGQEAIYTYDGSFIPWKDFNKDSSLVKAHIPEKFRDDN